MAIDTDSVLVKPVEADNANKQVGIDELRAAIPPECWKTTNWQAWTLLMRDVLLAGIIMYLAYLYIPLINDPSLRFVAWAFYGWLEGLVFTGLWVIGHDCGHGAFFPSKTVNDATGFLIHSFLMTPYFSWKATHRRHHMYVNHMDLDQGYVPPRKGQRLRALFSRVAENVEDSMQDAPIFTLLRIVMQQVFGFQAYLMFNITAAPSSLPKTPSKVPLGNSHFAPWGSLFRSEEANLVLISDLGLVAAALVMYAVGQHLGSGMTMLLYLQPYLWANNWIIAITYLHHTHPQLPKFGADSWTLVKGATATVDREFGFIGKHFFHGIIEFHVIHHLFARIPLYRAEEATQSIIPLLGDLYRADKQRSFLGGLWESFTQCRWVEPAAAALSNKDSNGNVNTPWYTEGALWYRAGRAKKTKSTEAPTSKMGGRLRMD